MGFTDGQMAEMSRILEQPNLLASARYAKESDFSAIRYAGKYHQSPVGSSEIYTIPFVIADVGYDEKTGSFSAKAVELPSVAFLKGYIDNERISFAKRYAGERPVVNYEGRSEDSGHIYRGTWSFDAEQSEMETSGEFNMVRVEDEERFIKALEEFCVE